MFAGYYSHHFYNALEIVTKAYFFIAVFEVSQNDERKIDPFRTNVPFLCPLATENQKLKKFLIAKF